MTLGQDLATSLVVNIRRTWLLTNVAILILTGGATAAVGPIGFVGLAAPHISRTLARPVHKWLLPYSAVIAGLVLLSADIIGRVIIFPAEIGAGIMTAFWRSVFHLACETRKGVRLMTMRVALGRV